MRRSTHMALAALAALSLTAFGCDEQSSRKDVERDPYAPGASLASTAGKKLLIQHEDGTPAGKWRVRREAIKVYGEDFAPIASARVKEHEGSVQVTVSSFDGQSSIKATIVDEDHVEVGKLMKLERRNDRWLILDRQELILAVITDASREGEVGERLDVRESLALQAPTIATITRDREEGTTTLSRGGDVSLEAPSRLPPAALLAYGLEHESLNPMTRAALAICLSRVYGEDVRRPALGKIGS